MKKNRPDVIYCGFYRAGSSFLRSYFSQHPDIRWTRNAQYFMSDEQYRLGEKHYFGLNNFEGEYKCFIDMFESLSMGYIFEKDLNWAEAGFNPGSPVDGKLIRPYHIEVARRIKDTLPEAKILMVLRNQTDWLRSIYLHQIEFLPKGKKKFSDFLNTLEGKSALFAGLFNNTIEAYYSLFGKENVLVLLLEQIAAEEEKHLRILCEFIGVNFVDFQTEKKDLNKGGGNVKGRFLKKCDALGFTDNSKQRLKSLLKYFSVLSFAFNKDILTSNEESLIHSFYSVSNYHTSNLLGIKLGDYGYPV